MEEHIATTAESGVSTNNTPIEKVKPDIPERRAKIQCPHVYKHGRQKGQKCLNMGTHDLGYCSRHRPRDQAVKPPKPKDQKDDFIQLEVPKPALLPKPTPTNNVQTRPTVQQMPPRMHPTVSATSLRDNVTRPQKLFTFQRPHLSAQVKTVNTPHKVVQTNNIRDFFDWSF